MVYIYLLAKSLHPMSKKPRKFTIRALHESRAENMALGESQSIFDVAVDTVDNDM